MRGKGLVVGTRYSGLQGDEEMSYNGRGSVYTGGEYSLESQYSALGMSEVWLFRLGKDGVSCECLFSCIVAGCMALDGIMKR